MDVSSPSQCPGPKFLCSLNSVIVLGFITLLNTVFLLFNLCKMRYHHVCKYPSSKSDCQRIKQYQTYILQAETERYSSVVIPNHTHELSVPKETTIPESVRCEEVFPHRKLFIGRITWGGFTGVLKEWGNPLELHIHQRLKHENIVKFFWSNLMDKPEVLLPEGGFQAPIRFYSMEYCGEGSLSSYLVRYGHQHLDLHRATRLVQNITAGLQHMHSLKIAHRDIKSDNVLITVHCGEFVAKISDFDHAIDSRNDCEMWLERKSRTNFGSPLYSSPEFILNLVSNPGGADFMSHDIFSLSLVVWECYTWVRCKIRLTTSHRGLEDSLLPRDPEYTTDIGNLKSAVNCSSTVHIPLVRQICKKLNLKYSKSDNNLYVRNVFFKQDRLIDTSLMRELYTLDREARPNSLKFRDSDGDFAWRLNNLLEGCWRTDPEERLKIDRIHQIVTEMCNILPSH